MPTLQSAFRKSGRARTYPTMMFFQIRENAGWSRSRRITPAFSSRVTEQSDIVVALAMR